jgi:hypothetical protein
MRLCRRPSHSNATDAKEFRSFVRLRRPQGDIPVTLLELLRLQDRGVEVWLKKGLVVGQEAQIEEAVHQMDDLNKVLGGYRFTRSSTVTIPGRLREYYSKLLGLKLTTESAELYRANGPN